MSNSPDWPFTAWLDVAVRIFGLSPQDFWTMSLLDWLTLLEQRAGCSHVKPISRQSLSQMMVNFPDENEGCEIRGGKRLNGAME